MAKTRPFAFVNGLRRSLSDVLQNGHPDRLLCGLQVGSSLYVLDLEKNQDLLPKLPNVFYYLPNGTGVSMKENLVTHCYYHGSVQGYPQSRVVLSSCSGLRGVIVINATLSFELHPEEEKHEKEEEGSGEMEEGWMHVIYPTYLQTSESRDCGVSHTSIPPIQITPHTHRSKRDILSEIKYIELVLVADHKELIMKCCWNKKGGMSLLTECKNLTKLTDPCCNASTCKLVPGAQCSSDGICCENCKLRVAGSVCREPLGDCDLPEYCTGTSPYCPPNVFLQNGESCKDGSSYCYSGVCASLDEQCQMLWGPNSTHAPPICFSSVNKQGNKYGNCGQMPNGSYIPCLKWNVHCGRIQCQGGNERPLLGSNVEILTTTVKLNQSDFTCRGAYFNLGDDVSDPAMVSQGTACGPNKACVDQKCRDVSMFGVEECHRKCNGHGVCNSNKNCHCDEGWAPPDCRYSGTGGSVDSGPAREPRDSDPARVALLVIFLFVLPVSLLFVALRFPRCRRGLVYLGHTPFNKSRQSRTPAMELANARNGDQVQPLRYQWPHQSDIPLTQAISKNPVPPKPPVPKKPLPMDPSSHPHPPPLLGHPGPATSSSSHSRNPDRCFFL
uniref:ADAM metallopeptidase domain 15 n=1 Tax=Sinocyclocheilus grahami TaxID=75366 RepID=A0A672QK48_SINGR